MGAESSERDAFLGTDETVAAEDAGASTTRRSPLPEAGSTIGRYEVVRKLGTGGMGIVFEARDPELDRRVAIKLLRFHETEGSAGPARLRREAQALAQLSHPYVVTVNDVGVHDGSTYVAMELVEGRTLEGWFEDGPHPWREVLDVFAAAGAGLAAAHRAEIVHRDFKPANVMLGPGAPESRRVCVMDFGLARAAGLVATEVGSAPASATDSASLTATGAVMGTPAYMAPEQFVSAADLTACSDQFSFCVALWEGLYGERPFAGTTVGEIAASVATGVPRDPPADTDVPGWIHRVLVRGLSVVPDARFDTMDALLDALRTGSGRRRQRLAAIAGSIALTVVAVAVAANHWEQDRAREACAAAGRAIDEVWNDERAATAATALAAAGVPDEAATEMLAKLDTHAAAWRKHASVACHRRDIENAWDPKTSAKAAWCLDERGLELDKAAAMMTSADEQSWYVSDLSSPVLLPVERCVDEAALAAMPTPPDPADWPRLRELSRTVDEIALLRELGRSDEALARSRDALAAAEARGWMPMHAKVQATLADVLVERGELEAAIQAATTAYEEALGAGAWAIAAHAAATLMSLHADDRGDFVEARKWADHAQTAVYRAGDAGGILGPTLLLSLAHIESAAGTYRESRDLLERALVAFSEALGPDNVQVAIVHNNLGGVYEELGEPEAALEHLERALSIGERALGENHPRIAVTLNNMGALAGSAGQYEKALDLFRRSGAIQERAFGRNSRLVANSIANQGEMLYWLGRHDEALAKHEEALAIRESLFGEDHPTVVSSLDALAKVHRWMDDDPAEARALSERSLAIGEKVFGPDHVRLTGSLLSLGQFYNADGNHEKAASMFARAVEIREATFGPEHTSVTMPLIGLAGARAEMGDMEEASALLERAIEIASKDDRAEPLAQAKFAKAKLMWLDEDARPAALALAEEARGGLPADHDNRIPIDEWLEDRRAGL